MPKRTSSYHDRLLEDLRDPQEAANYINAAIEDGSPELLLLALRHVAEAHQMSKVAKSTGVAREAIYRILSRKGNPRLSSLWGLFPTLGLEFVVRPCSRPAMGGKPEPKQRRPTRKSHKKISKRN